MKGMRFEHLKNKNGVLANEPRVFPSVEKARMCIQLRWVDREWKRKARGEEESRRGGEQEDKRSEQRLAAFLQILPARSTLVLTD